MGRPFRECAVVKAYDGNGEFLEEDIVPLASFRVSGSLLLNSATVRAARGIRFISFRIFDESGQRTHYEPMTFNRRGEQAPIYRRPDRSIIEDPDWV